MGLTLLCEALCEIIAAVPERYKRPRLLPRITMTQQIISGSRAQRPGNRSADFYFLGQKLTAGQRGGKLFVVIKLGGLHSTDCFLVAAGA